MRSCIQPPPSPSMLAIVGQIRQTSFAGARWHFQGWLGMAHEKDGARSLPSVLQRLKHSSDVKGKLHPSEAAATGLSFRGEPHLAENVRRQKEKKKTQQGRITEEFVGLALTTGPRATQDSTCLRQKGSPHTTGAVLFHTHGLCILGNQCHIPKEMTKDGKDPPLPAQSLSHRAT